MSQCIRRRRYFITSMAPHTTARLFIIIICISLMISIIWIQLVEKEDPSSLVAEALQNVARDHRYAEVYRKVEKLQKDTKYILLWTSYEFSPFYYFGIGQRAFIDKNCEHINCYVTTDKRFFNGDTTKFHAIAFNGRNIDTITKSQLPVYRSPQQKFIYVNSESADNYPVCDDIFDNFFNWVSTYRLDSDVPFPYIQIKNFKGDIVGPKRNMKWSESTFVLDDDLEAVIQNKSKAVAWFVSHCSSRSGREVYVKQLQKALQKYSLTVDIYGACGTLKCPKSKKHSCYSILEREYYFYLAFENSFAEDYVTEKLLTALQHDAVPIVYGGANYSRFLPPGSYLNARNSNPDELAKTIVEIISSKDKYKKFFSWKLKYTYHDPGSRENVCSLCKALNDKELVKNYKIYKDFRKWWNPHYGDICKV